MRFFEEPELLPDEEIIYETYSFPLFALFFLLYLIFSCTFLYSLQDINLVGYLIWKTPIFIVFFIYFFLFIPFYKKNIITNKHIILKRQNIIFTKYYSKCEDKIAYQDISEIKEYKLFKLIKTGFINIKYNNNKLIPNFVHCINAREFVLHANKQLELYNSSEHIQENCKTSKNLTKKTIIKAFLFILIIYGVFLTFILKFPKQFSSIIDHSAMPFAKTAVYFNPNDGLAYKHLGSAFVNIDKYNEAIKNYKYAIKLDPNNTAYYYNLAYSYHKSKQFDLEIQTLKQILRKVFKINNKYTFTLAKLAEVYKLKGDYRLAIEYYKKAIKLSPKVPNLYVGLGTIYKDLGNYKESENLFKKTLQFSDKEISDRCLDPQIIKKNLTVIKEVNDKNKSSEYLKKNFVENMYK